MANVSVNLAPLAAAIATIIVAGRPRFHHPIRNPLAASDPTSFSRSFGSVAPLSWLATRRNQWVTRRRARRFGPAELATWIDDVSRSIRRGATLRQTIISVTPTDSALEAATVPLRHRLERGAGVAEASAEWGAALSDSNRRSDRQLIAVASVLSISSSVGGGSSAPLDRLAAAMRQAAADDLERGAQSAQALMSARVLTLVPVAMLAVLLAIDADVRDVVRTATGGAVISCGLALNLFGGWWMRHIITTSVQ